MIRVAYIGNFAHAHCTEVGVARALEANGCEVHRVQQEQVGDAAILRSNPPDGRPDLVLYTRTHNRWALPSSWTDVWSLMQDAGIVTASLHLDRYWDLDREHLIHDRDPLFTTQHVFTADGGNQERFAAAGVNHHWMAPAIDEQAIGDPLPVILGEIDVLFAGTVGGYHGEYGERRELVDHLQRTYKDRFVHVGLGGLPKVHGDDLTRLYRSAKIVVGDSCFANQPGTLRPNDRYWSDRIPETLGRGGFLIHPWVEGLGTQYDTGRHLVTHAPGDWDDLDAQIGSYLCVPGEREAIATEGHAHVLREHTWTVRVREILATVGLSAGARSSALSDPVTG